MISCRCYKVKNVTSIILLHLSMNHFILLVCALLLCPSETSYRTCVIAPWQEQFFIRINHSYWDMGFFLTWLLPPSLLSSLSSQPQCFTVIVINNTFSVKPLSSEPRFPGLHPIRVGPETVYWVIYWPSWVSDRFFLCQCCWIAFKYSSYVLCCIFCDSWNNIKELIQGKIKGKQL